jgi:hypothetical protein
VYWVTKRGIKINRAATAWLIRRFVDPEAIFVFVAAGDVGGEARNLGGTGFHAPGTMYPARDTRGRTPFEAIAEDRCGDDAALRAMSVIVRHADVPQQSEAPEAAGLRLISGAFPLIARDDHDTVERSAFMYDALYAALREREEGARRKGPAASND